MPWWSVQAAWQGGLHPQSVGRSEERAKRDVERLLYSWLTPHLVGHGQFYQSQGARPDYWKHALWTAEEIQRLLGAGDIWGAYDAFHAFLDRWDKEFGMPMWYMLGTVIVEAPERMGPRTRKRFITQEDFPKEPPPGFLRMETQYVQKEEHLPPGQYRMKGGEMGAKCRFLIWKADRQGRYHSTCFMRWEDAARRLGNLLRKLAYNIMEHALDIDPESPHREYALAARTAAASILGKLDGGDVYGAYDDYQLFEVSYEDEFREPFTDLFGKVRLEVD